MTKASTNEPQFCPNKKNVKQVCRSKVHHINENFEIGISHHCPIKKIENIKAFVDYTNKNYHSLPFINDILNEVVDHELYSFKDGYSGYNQIKIMNENILKTICTTPWGTFAYSMMSFELCSALGTFQKGS